MRTGIDRKLSLAYSDVLRERLAERTSMVCEWCGEDIPSLNHIQTRSPWKGAKVADLGPTRKAMDEVVDYFTVICSQCNSQDIRDRRKATWRNA